MSTTNRAKSNCSPNIEEALGQGGLASAAAQPLWYSRAAEKLGVTPVTLMLAVGVGVALITVLVQFQAGTIAYQRRPFERFVPYMVALGALLTIWIFELSVRWARHAFDALRPHLIGSAAQIDKCRSGLTSYPRAIYWLGGLFGLAFTLPFHEANTQRWSRFAAGDWNAFDVWVVLAVSFYSIFLYQLLVALLLTVRSLGRVGQTMLETDLFDPDRGRPIARFGLRLVLLVSLAGIAGVLAPGLVGVAAPGSAVGAMAVNLVWCAVCLTLCLRGLVRRMGQLKREELARVDRAIVGVPGALDDSPTADRLRAPGFIELLTYRRELVARRIWPVDAGMWGRLLLYLVLPPLSWVAAALVEEGVGALLGN